MLFMEKKPVETMKKNKKNSQVVIYAWIRSTVEKRINLSLQRHATLFLKELRMDKRHGRKFQKCKNLF